jgi:hypothetical protein
MEKITKTQKQPYSAPQLVDHGDAVKATKGAGGRCWEFLGSSHCPIIED